MWFASLLQAGGLGIYGDLLFSDVNRFGGGIGTTVAGPLGQRFDTAVGENFQSVVNWVNGKPTNFARTGVKMARQWTPGQNHWMLNQVPHVAPRVLFDKLQILVDPHARKSFHDEARKRQRDYGQEYFWPRGEPAPLRAPDFSRVMSQR